MDEALQAAADVQLLSQVILSKEEEKLQGLEACQGSAQDVHAEFDVKHGPNERIVLSKVW